MSFGIFSDPEVAKDQESCHHWTMRVIKSSMQLNSTLMWRLQPRHQHADLLKAHVNVSTRTTPVRSYLQKLQALSVDDVVTAIVVFAPSLERQGPCGQKFLAQTYQGFDIVVNGSM